MVMYFMSSQSFFHLITITLHLTTVRANRKLQSNDDCKDAVVNFKVEGTAGNGMRSCDWVNRRAGGTKFPWRCNAFPEAALNCPVSCGTCTEAPSYNPTMAPTILNTCNQNSAQDTFLGLVNPANASQSYVRFFEDHVKNALDPDFLFDTETYGKSRSKPLVISVSAGVTWTGLRSKNGKEISTPIWGYSAGRSRKLKKISKR
jgi:hypothetical protein